MTDGLGEGLRTESPDPRPSEHYRATGTNGYVTGTREERSMSLVTVRRLEERRTKPGSPRARASRPTRRREAGHDNSGPDPERDPVASLHRAVGNRGVQSLVRESSRARGGTVPTSREGDGRSAGGRSPGPTADMCPRCARRYREGKPLDCEDCERELLSGNARGETTGEARSDGMETTHRQRPEEDRERLVDGVLATAAWPACYGDALSGCNPDTGNYDILYNNSTCCTRECVQLHEEQHVADLGDCCRNLANRIAAGGDRGALIGRYNGWMRGGAADWSECNAYQVDLGCMHSLSAENDCDIRSSECCSEIAGDMSMSTRQMNDYCSKAPATRPACPL